MRPDQPPTDDRGDPLAAMAASVARVADLLEARIAPALERIAGALERAPAVPAAGAVPPDLERRTAALAAIRLAIAESRWEHAETLAEDFAREFPDDAEVPALRDRLDRGRDEAIGALRSRLEASRSVNDPESVIALHDELTVLLRGEARRELEREVVRWLIGLLQRRMRSGTVRPDVVELAARVAERFGATPEGASVRASLPTLRRSVGLCPRCGGPYAGIEAACPRCLAGATSPADAESAPWVDPGDDLEPDPAPEDDGEAPAP